MKAIVYIPTNEAKVNEFGEVEFIFETEIWEVGNEHRVD